MGKSAKIEWWTDKKKTKYNKYIISVTDYRGTSGVSKKNNKKCFSLCIPILYKSGRNNGGYITDFFYTFIPMIMQIGIANIPTRTRSPPPPSPTQRRIINLTRFLSCCARTYAHVMSHYLYLAGIIILCIARYSFINMWSPYMPYLCVERGGLFNHARHSMKNK